MELEFEGLVRPLELVAVPRIRGFLESRQGMGHLTNPGGGVRRVEAPASDLESDIGTRLQPEDVGLRGGWGIRATLGFAAKAVEDSLAVGLEVRRPMWAQGGDALARWNREGVEIPGLLTRQGFRGKAEAVVGKVVIGHVGPRIRAKGGRLGHVSVQGRHHARMAGPELGEARRGRRSSGWGLIPRIVCGRSRNGRGDWREEV